MPTMRHPNVAGPYDAHEDQVPSHRMVGWLTKEEAPELFAERERAEAEAAAVAEQDGGAVEEPQDDRPEDSGEQKKAPRRSRTRATSEGNED